MIGDSGKDRNLPFGDANAMSNNLKILRLNRGACSIESTLIG
jgi:hypothetical protein